MVNMGVYCKISRRPLEIRAAQIEYCSHVRNFALRRITDPACYHHIFGVLYTPIYIYIGMYPV